VRTAVSNFSAVLLAGYISFWPKRCMFAWYN